MHVGVKKSLTAGSSVVVAGAVALIPVTHSPPGIAPVAQAVRVDLTAVTDPVEAAAIVARGFSASADLLAYYAVDAAAAVLVGAYDLGQQDPRSFYSTVRQIVSAPAIVVSPTAEAFAQVLPSPVGGTDGDPWNNTAADGAIVDFVDHVLRPASDAINAQIAQALHAYPDTGTPLPDPSQAGPPANLFQGAVTLAFGVGGTAVRALQSVVVSPLAVARLAILATGAVITGNNKSLYLAVRDIVDAPLWAADPTIDALAKVLPRPVGGTDGKHEVSSSQDGQIIQFRDKVLWGATNAVRNGVAKALNVDPTYGDPLPSLKAVTVDPEPDAVTEVTAKSSGTVEPIATPAASTACTAQAPARVAGRGTVVGNVDADAGASARAAKAGPEISARPGRGAVRAEVKRAAGRLNVSVKRLNDRLRGSAKDAVALNDSARRSSAGAAH